MLLSTLLLKRNHNTPDALPLLHPPFSPPPPFLPLNTIRMPPYHRQTHQHHQPPQPQKYRKHDPLLLQRLDIRIHQLPHQTVAVAPIAPNRSRSDRLRRLVDLIRGEHERGFVHFRDVDVQVIVQEGERFFESVDFTPDETLHEFLRGLFEDRPVEDQSDEVLDVGVEGDEGVVQRACRAVDPAEETVVDRGLDGVDAGVDVVGIGGGLVVHALVDGRRYRVREIGDGGSGTGLILRLEGMDSNELYLDGENAKEADEEAGQSWRMEDVLEEPAEVDMALWL